MRGFERITHMSIRFVDTLAASQFSKTRHCEESMQRKYYGKGKIYFASNV